MLARGPVTFPCFWKETFLLKPHCGQVTAAAKAQGKLLSLSPLGQISPGLIQRTVWLTRASVMLCWMSKSQTPVYKCSLPNVVCLIWREQPTNRIHVGLQFCACDGQHQLGGRLFWKKRRLCCTIPCHHLVCSTTPGPPIRLSTRWSRKAFGGNSE